MTPIKNRIITPETAATTYSQGVVTFGGSTNVIFRASTEPNTYTLLSGNVYQGTTNNSGYGFGHSPQDPISNPTTYQFVYGSRFFLPSGSGGVWNWFQGSKTNTAVGVGGPTGNTAFARLFPTANNLYFDDYPIPPGHYVYLMGNGSAGTWSGGWLLWTKFQSQY